MTTKAMCWLVTRADGEVMRATGLDVDLTVTATGYEGVYGTSAGVTSTAIKSNSSMAVDNLEVSGALNTSREVGNQWYVTAQDIEGGMWDQARVKVFECDADDPSSVDLLQNGVIGEITRTQEGGYTAEIRDLFQLLQQNIGEMVSITCRAQLGSGAEAPLIKRCGVNLTLYAVAGSVTSITRQQYDWTDSSLAQAASYFRDGIVTWLTGLNAGLRSQTRRHLTGGRIILDTATPYALTIGDTYSITPGCDHLFATCRDKFNNAVNFRGEPYLPGIDAIIAGEGEQ